MTRSVKLKYKSRTTIYYAMEREMLGMKKIVTLNKERARERERDRKTQLAQKIGLDLTQRWLDVGRHIGPSSAANIGSMKL